MGVPVNNTLVRHAVFLATDTLPRVLMLNKNTTGVQKSKANLEAPFSLFKHSTKKYDI